MTTYIGLLRAVNLGPHNKIAMADLRELLTRLGMRDVQTLLQSGNVVFRSDVRSAAELEGLIEGAAAKQLRLTTDVLLRSDKEWKAIIADNPFPKDAKVDPSHLLAVVLKTAPERTNVRRYSRRSPAVRSSTSAAGVPTSSTRMASAGRVSRAR
jgi:uncharacterized protein (DUF1697 family)